MKLKLTWNKWEIWAVCVTVGANTQAMAPELRFWDLLDGDRRLPVRFGDEDDSEDQFARGLTNVYRMAQRGLLS